MTDNKKYYDSVKDKICERGCGVRIEFRGSNEYKKHSTGWYEVGTKIEHTFPRCDNLLKIIKIRSQHGTLF